ncbi:MAG: hypothetical protein K0R83_355 [Caulobacter sp.]|jgi:hypothetical protein|nr:hypothetical protein [Caulobacter sp.]
MTGTTRDLTRWNRTGVTHFDYVDGNAATFLEDLRTAMLARFLRGASGDAREADFWRTLFAGDPADWPAALALRPDLDWPALMADFPSEPETALLANRRLLAAYDAKASDYGLDIMRAFARAAHVLMGHANAYANEGYLRTATQWESVRRLAAMVSYHPTPPASAFTEIALIAAEDPPAASLVDRGVAMKASPPQGGPALIFETLRPAWVHPLLNAMRAQGWDQDTTLLTLGSGVNWLVGRDPPPAVGELVVAEAGGVGRAATVAHSVRGVEGVAGVGLDGDVSSHSWPAWNTRLWTSPANILRPSLQYEYGRLVVETANTTRFRSGDIVKLAANGREYFLIVEATTATEIAFRTMESINGAVSLTPMTPFVATGYDWFVDTQPSVVRVYFNRSNTVTVVEKSDEIVVIGGTRRHGRRMSNNASNGVLMAYRYPTDRLNERAFGLTGAETAVPGRALGQSAAFPGQPPGAPTFVFLGKPPKELAVGDHFVARCDALLTPLRVAAVRTEPDRYFILFNQLPARPTGVPPEWLEFHGPMKRSFRPVDFDRSREPAVGGGGVVIFDAIPPAAADLLTPGRPLIVEDESVDPRPPARAAIVSTSWNAARTVLTVVLDADAPAFAGFRKGWTVFRGNTVAAGHGESLGPKVIGSGNGEASAQTFNIPLDDISFVPSTGSDSGYAPDIEVQVAGRIWEMRDLADPTAEGAEAYSPALADDGTLDLHFRRRLTTGVDNVVVTRHRTGSGLAGNAVAPYSFEKPIDKHALVTAIVQPFAASGGAEREPVADIRTNAPGRLAANDRAVSLEDFARLARRNAAVWQARAALVLAPGREQVVTLTIVPAGGGVLTAALQTALSAYFGARALPNTRVQFQAFTPVPVRVTITSLRIDEAHYPSDRVKDAVREALLGRFSLKRRDLGQGLFIGEILAAIDGVTGVINSTATLTLAQPAFAPATLGASQTLDQQAAGAFRALHPAPDQVAYLAAPTDIVLEQS